jgi:hypothetical protein
MNTAFNHVTPRPMIIPATTISPDAIPASPVTTCARIRFDMMIGESGE